MNPAREGAALNPEDLLGDGLFSSPPEVYARIRRLVGEPGSAISRMTQLIERDPILTERLLRVANSAFFPLVHPVASIHDAVVLLGTREVKHLVLATEVIQRFESVPQVDVYSHWHDSLRCAVLARLLGRRAMPAFDANGLFMSALLHGIGHVVIYTRIPAQGLTALRESRRLGIALDHAQRTTMGFDYADVGAALAARWRFPPLMCAVIANHLAPEQSAGYRAEAAVVHLALAASRAGGFDAPAMLAAVPKNRVLWRLARVGPEDLVGVAPEADEAFRGALGLFH